MSLTTTIKRNFFSNHKTKKTPEHQLPKENQANPYSHSVLIGNWFEERFAHQIDHKAITPGIYGQTNCALEKSLYNDNFQQPIPSNAPEEFVEFINWRQQGFSNRLNSEQTNIKLWDGNQFAKNLTTFKDIMFRLQPEEAKKQKESSLLKRKPYNKDYMQSFGNSTSTGLMFWRECESKREDHIPLDVSHYKHNFKHIQLPYKRVLCKREQKITSI